MPITKRKVLPRPKKRRKPPPPDRQQVSDALVRMGKLLAAGHGDERMAQIYFRTLYGQRLANLIVICARAEKERKWSFMEGSYKLAAELYVLASILYEKYPEDMILTDAAYDHLARWLLKHMRKLPKSFRDWYGITALDLKAGTGMSVTTQEPIRWMVYLRTGKELPEITAPKVKPKPRKRISKRKDNG